MTELFQTLINFLTSLAGFLSSVIGILLILLIYIVMNPEKVETWHSILARTFSYFSERSEKAAVATDIQAKINSFAKNMNNETLGAMPYGVKIEWTKEVTKEAFLQSEEIIVRMKHHNEQPKNIVYAALAYVSKGFLPHGRHYLEEKVARSADHIITRKIFINRNLTDALQLYVSEFLDPEVNKDPSLRQYYELFEKLDQTGWLTKIFAREIEHLGLKIYPTIASASLLKETADFVDFLKMVIEREPGAKISTIFLRQHFAVGIALIAKYETVIYSGIDPHLKWIDDCWKKGVQTVYVCARSPMNVEVAKLVAKESLKSRKVEKVKEHIDTIRTPEGKNVPSIVIVLRRLVNLT